MISDQLRVVLAESLEGATRSRICFARFAPLPDPKKEEQAARSRGVDGRVADEEAAPRQCRARPRAHAGQDDDAVDARVKPEQVERDCR